MNESSNSDEVPSPAELEIMHRHLLGNAEPAEFAKLERDLLASAEVRTRFLRALRVDAALQEVAARGQPAPVEKVTVFPWRRMLAAAAAVLALAAVGWWTLGPRVNREALEVATLIDARDCQWAKGTRVAVEGRLAPGLLNLASGVALIEFDGGARLALQGPASLEISGPKSARLQRGSATVRCEDGAEGFSLLTPTSTVIDLGTEFGVAVAADGGTEVEVLDGSVEVAGASNQSTASTRVLSAGEALQIKADGTDRVDTAKPTGWVRDYTSKAEREVRAQPPRLFAQDIFSTQGVKSLEEYTGGFGWQGPWKRATQGRRPPSYFAPLESLTEHGPASGESLVLGGRQELRRLLAMPIDPTRRQILYIGFSFQRLEPNRIGAAPRAGVSVMLRAATVPTSFLAAGLSAKNRWSASDSGGEEHSESDVSGSDPYYVIARIDFRPKAGTRVAISAHPLDAEVPVKEPTKWDLITRWRTANPKVPLDIIALRTLDPIGITIGEIHVGNSWAAVARPSAVAK